MSKEGPVLELTNVVDWHCDGKKLLCLRKCERDKKTSDSPDGCSQFIVDDDAIPESGLGNPPRHLQSYRSASGVYPDYTQPSKQGEATEALLNSLLVC